MSLFAGCANHHSYQSTVSRSLALSRKRLLRGYRIHIVGGINRLDGQILIDGDTAGVGYLPEIITPAGRVIFAFWRVVADCASKLYPTHPASHTPPAVKARRRHFLGSMHMREPTSPDSVPALSIYKTFFFGRRYVFSTTADRLHILSIHVH